MYEASCAAAVLKSGMNLIPSAPLAIPEASSSRGETTRCHAMRALRQSCISALAKSDRQRRASIPGSRPSRANRAHISMAHCWLLHLEHPSALHSNVKHVMLGVCRRPLQGSWRQHRDVAGASITICICPNAQSTRVMSLSLSLEKKAFYDTLQRYEHVAYLDIAGPELTAGCLV